MKKNKSIQLKLIIVFISLFIIAIMFYLNYENYKFNKGKLINELQITLDNSVEKYFIDDAKVKIEDLAKQTENNLSEKDKRKYQEFRKKRAQRLKGSDRDKRIKQILKFNKISEKKDSSIRNNNIDEGKMPDLSSRLKKITLQKTDGNYAVFLNDSSKKDTVRNVVFVGSNSPNKPIVISKSNVKTIDLKGFEDVKSNNKNLVIPSVQFINEKRSNQQIVINKSETNFTLKSFKSNNIKPMFLFSDTFLVEKTSENLKKALQERKFSKEFKIEYQKKGKLKGAANSGLVKIDVKPLIAKSDFLFQNNQLKFYYNNLEKDVLKVCMLPISLSFLLTIGIVICMIYFFNIIKKQDEVNEMKNDFISNITHELKTPIAVVKSAIEGIQYFNTTNDIEKTKKYLSISNNELIKLNKIVEKILETASLDNKDIILKKSKIEIVTFLDLIAQKNQEKTNKKITFLTSIKELNYEVDEFHFESIINNLLENAIKYGGNKIEMNLEEKNNQILISVIDNGKGILKKYQDKIFDKFYRIPTQNIHNVKGFGVGLYYVKQMVEKHQGTIHLDMKTDATIFKISLPYGKN